MRVKTEEELAKAIKNGEDTIEIEGNLRKTVLKIKATGKVAWLIAIAAIGIAVGIFIATGGTGAPASSFIGGGAISVLGLPAAISAVSIAIAAGSVGVLNKLRDYKIIENNDDVLILKK